jgi:hypothetical protein
LNRHYPNDLSLTTIAGNFHDSTLLWRFDKTGPADRVDRPWPVGRGPWAVTAKKQQTAEHSNIRTAE